MKKIKKIIMLITLSSLAIDLHAASTLVYNLRIAETTTSRRFEEFGHLPWVAASTLVGQFRQSRADVNQALAGGLVTLSYAQKNWFVRLDFAAAHVRSHSSILPELDQSRTQTDDLLLSGGYGFSWGERSQFSLSGLLGIPTHKPLDLPFVQFGSGHVGLGIQLDNNFKYCSINSLRSAARYIHFFQKQTTSLEIFNPAIFDFTYGNAVDLYVAHRTHWKQKHMFDFGYNPTFFFGAHIEPKVEEEINVEDINDELNFIRSNFFAAYRRYFLIKGHPSGVTFGISAGFDHIPKRTGLKNIVSFWASWGITF
ncbi:MAG: hypothetical protein ACOYT8_06565 [Candidatus Dependentiae bacterium]